MPSLDQYKQIPKAEFDTLARGKKFKEGPWKDTFGDGPGEPYIPLHERWLFGTLETGRRVKAKQREEELTMPKTIKATVREVETGEQETAPKRTERVQFYAHSDAEQVKFNLVAFDQPPLGFTVGQEVTITVE